MNNNTVAAVELNDVTRCFPGAEEPALSDISLSIKPGEFFSLLGPSGCGKTTLLRLIAGFDTPTQGNVYLSGQEVTNLPANKRDVNLVFQAYALFPHLTIEQNIGFGLKRKHVAKPEVRRRVQEMLELVELQGRGKAKPKELSGGQQQRVALARALINEPKALLLDEPLAALDLKLRQTMKEELKRIQQEVGITFVYVTHDQGEALSLSTNIAVMNKGKVEQIGSPQQLYESPATPFVAGFIGSANVLPASRRINQNGQVEVCLANGARWLSHSNVQHCEEEQLAVMIRPERVVVQPLDRVVSNDMARVSGTVLSTDYMGNSWHYKVRTSDGTVMEATGAPEHGGLSSYQAGSEVLLTWDPLLTSIVNN